MALTAGLPPDELSLAGAGGVELAPAPVADAAGKGGRGASLSTPSEVPPSVPLVLGLLLGLGFGGPLRIPRAAGVFSPLGAGVSLLDAPRPPPPCIPCIPCRVDEMWHQAKYERSERQVVGKACISKTATLTGIRGIQGGAQPLSPARLGEVLS